MAKIVLAWELGSGLGHLVRLRPIAQRLVAAGHAVTLIAKDVVRAKSIFDDLNIKVLQAPILKSNFRRIRQSFTFAHVLHNAGFASLPVLAAQTRVWRQYFLTLQPQVLVCDHSPTALLAARGLPIRTVAIGTGFTCPALTTPFENLRPKQSVRSDRLLAHEQLLVRNLNRWLQRCRAPQLRCLAQLYQEADQTFLTTFAELDPYRGRSSAEYWGAWSYARGEPAQWPPDEGAKCFAYLKPFPALDEFLQKVSQRRLSMLIVGSANLALDGATGSGSIRFTHRPVDIHEACQRADVAILNGTHGATVAALLAGKPILHLPIYLEQGLTAQRVEVLGAGRLARLHCADQIDDCLHELLTASKYREAAAAFTLRYAEFRPDDKLDELVNRIQQ